MKSKNLFCIVLAFMFIQITLVPSGIVFAANTDTPFATFTNNVSKPDTVTVTNVVAGDIVNVYSEPVMSGSRIVSKAVLLGTGKAASDGDLTVSLTKQITGGQMVDVTLTNYNKLESMRRTLIAPAEQVTAFPNADNITFQNNVSKADTVTVKNLLIGDTVNVYTLPVVPGTLIPAKAVLLGTGKATSNGDLIVSLTKQITGAQMVNVTVANDNKLESGMVTINVPADPVSIAPLSSNITVNNNSSKADTVTVRNISAGDTVKIYSVEAKPVILGTGKATLNGDFTVTLTKKITGGQLIGVTITNDNKLESSKQIVIAAGDPVTTTPIASNVIIENNVSKADTVTVKNLTIGDIVNVYSRDTKPVLLGTGKATTSGDFTVTLTKKITGGQRIDVTVTNDNKLESNKLTLTVPYEETTITPRG